jgi:hypothetical protein
LFILVFDNCMMTSCMWDKKSPLHVLIFLGMIDLNQLSYTHVPRFYLKDNFDNSFCCRSVTSCHRLGFVSGFILNRGTTLLYVLEPKKTFIFFPYIYESLFSQFYVFTSVNISLHDIIQITNLFLQVGHHLDQWLCCYLDTTCI